MVRNMLLGFLLLKLSSSVGVMKMKNPSDGLACEHW